jgi:hypothetical protein
MYCTATIASKYEKHRRGNKEYGALIISARSQVIFQQNKKLDEVFESMGKKDGDHGFPKTGVLVDTSDKLANGS